MATQQRLQNKKVIVTGGSRGIGREIVLGLAREGAHVLFTYHRNEDAAKATVQAARTLHNNNNVMATQTDFSEPAAMKSVFEFIPKNFGGEADIYIANAFTEAAFAPTAFMNEQDYDRMFASVKGHYFALQQAAHHINEHGRIIVISSGAAAQPGIASGAYSGAKAALEKFAVSLAKELGSKNIAVNVLSPGVTATEGLVAPQEMINALVAQTPFGRLGKPEDVANAVVALCLPETAWVTGQVIQANGGIL
ncbi:MAG: SDR family oxidoreductase [Candidatus Kapabacteria bacterium]|jgi:3-oxoacyl-[acyl-carrier protein] reductase|nr:SDR family oxidoreductase [Candidatus Kapabacteria bacterium]